MSTRDYSLCVVECDIPEGLRLSEYRRVRTCVARHPNYTVQAVADAVGLSIELVMLALAGRDAIVEHA
jgi:hypothetical protein